MFTSTTFRMNIAVLFLALILAAAPAVAADINAGDMIPETLKATKLDGTEVSLLESVKGSNTALVFYNTVCNRCIQEVKWLLETMPDAKLHLISIDLGGAAVVENWKKTALKGYRTKNITMYTDPDFVIAGMFGFSFTPATALLDKEGKIVRVFSGYNEKAKPILSDHLK